MKKFLKSLFGLSKSDNDKSANQDIDTVFKQLQPAIQKTGKACISIKTQLATTLRLDQSKFGGIPKFPKDQEFPRDRNGMPLRFLAQINFSEIPYLSPFPKKGLLQFFIGEDDLFGLDFDNPINQSGSRVFYWEETDFAELKDFSAIYSSEWEESPLHQSPLALTFSLKTDVPSAPAMEYYDLILPLFEGELEDDLEDLYLDQELASGHKIGGFPYFTQNEPRDGHIDFAEYELLFQIDSDEDKVMWGDVGVANFFIKKSDLVNRDFSSVLYNWDCH